ncbi:MAG: hypothetical protein OJF59_001692 [Cytophagales bacterium]|nr:MAG: hypothetical protein OJF59_001692 [Cytophagales bacterium]
MVIIAANLHAQTLEKKLPSFKKIVASPKINLVLVEGDEESIKINYTNIDASKINVKVKNQILKIYLTGSRFIEKRNRVQHSGEVYKEYAYRNASVTAYVTYRKLNKLVVRGEQEIDVQGKIETRKFKLAAYGGCVITLASLHTDKLKTSLYGQHTLKIKSGNAKSQKYKLFGENRIDTQALQCSEIASTTYGESKLKINAQNNLSLFTVGESNVVVTGSPEISKLTLGEVSIHK